MNLNQNKHLYYLLQQKIKNKQHKQEGVENLFNLISYELDEIYSNKANVWKEMREIFIEELNDKNLNEKYNQTIEMINKINYPIKYIEYKRIKKEMNDFYKIQTELKNKFYIIKQDAKNKEDLEFMKNLK